MWKWLDDTPGGGTMISRGSDRLVTRLNLDAKPCRRPIGDRLPVAAYLVVGTLERYIMDCIASMKTPPARADVDSGIP